MLDNIRYAGLINQKAIECGFEIARPGITLRQIDETIEGFILNNSCKPAFKNYQPEGYPKPFPASACISPNDIVVHGIPGDYVLKDGDLLTIDVGTEYQGFFADSARSRVIGVGNERAEYLIKATEAILMAQLAVVKDGCNFLSMVKAAEEAALKYNVTIMPQFGGHAIGDRIHLPPFIPSTIDRTQGLIKQKIEENRYARQILKEGQTICIEPVVTYSPTNVIIDADQWTVRTADGSLAAHTERCIVILREGYELLS